jgi:ABC-type antimicrobial peptide transport system permease subunit
MFTALSEIAARVRALFRRDDLDRDFQQELDSHVAMLTEDNIRRGMGLRLALGAMRRDIIQQFLGQGLRVAAVACVCGLALSFVTTGVLSDMLFGVSPSDPVTLSSVIGIVLTVTTLAALIPAVRAALVEPIRALRDE